MIMILNQRRRRYNKVQRFFLHVLLVLVIFAVASVLSNWCFRAINSGPTVKAAGQFKPAGQFSGPDRM